MDDPRVVFAVAAGNERPSASERSLKTAVAAVPPHVKRQLKKPEPGKLSRTIRRVMAPLVRADYEAVEALTAGERLSAPEVAQAVADYGRQLVSPPADSAPRSVVELEGTGPARWSVYVNLWTSEEGRSDLTLELTITDSTRDEYDPQIDNIHVL